MLTVNCRRVHWLALPALLAGLLAGCTPPGPRALLDGQALLDQGRPTDAIEPLQEATRFLTNNSHAWNHLGVAYHRAGQATNAVLAYQRALELNRDLLEARYNLGCLWFEQGRYEPAKSEFIAFNLRRNDVPDAWLKLGLAQLRTRELGPAEQSLNQARRLRPTDAETLNALGLTCVQRARYRDAAAYFQAAAQPKPSLPAAHLNLAVLHQTYLRDRAAALQHYADYLALRPLPEDWQTIADLARRLELELLPAPKPTNAPPVLVLVTNPPRPVATVATNPPRPVATAATNLVKPVATNLARVTPAPVPTNRPAPPPTPPLVAAVPRTNPPVVAPTVTTVSAPAPVPVPVPVPVPAPPPREVVSLPPEPELAEARDVAARPPTPAPDMTIIAVVPFQPVPEPPPPTAEPEEKKGFFEKLNPLSLLKKSPKPAPRPTPLPTRAEVAASSASRTNVVTPPPAAPVVTNKVAATRTNRLEPIPAAPALRSEPVKPPPPTFPPYAYRRPAAPAPGSRAAAEPAFRKALQAHQAGSLEEAKTDYRAALAADPGYFEAWHNLALAQVNTREVTKALDTYELALAVKPDSAEARCNFALALQQAGHVTDAAKELEAVLAEAPNHLRAHLALATICAQQLRDPARARPHFAKVLELDPRHPQAAPIRSWLAANPP